MLFIAKSKNLHSLKEMRLKNLEDLNIWVVKNDGKTKKVHKDLFPPSCFESISLCKDSGCAGLPTGNNTNTSTGQVFL